MISILARLEHKVGNNVYHFFAAHDAPIQEVKDALITFLAQAVNMSAGKNPSEAPAVAPEAPAVSPDAVISDTGV